MEEQQARMHVDMEVFDVYVDAHLANFKVRDHYDWMDYLVDHSILLMGHRKQYRQYTDAWIQYHNIQLAVFPEIDDEESQ